MTFPQRLLAIHRSLDRNGIPHAFGGAVALAYSTLSPRGTIDIDINVFVPAEECRVALAALPPEVKQPQGTVEKVERDGQVRLWWEETPVDLFFDNLPIHEQAAAHSQVVEFDGAKIPVLGPVELAVFKAMFDRTKDWADIEAMLEANAIDLVAMREDLRSLNADQRTFDRLDEAIRQADASKD